jgi:hypothetical protein
VKLAVQGAAVGEGVADGGVRVTVAVGGAGVAVALGTLVAVGVVVLPGTVVAVGVAVPALGRTNTGAIATCPRDPIKITACPPVVIGFWMVVLPKPFAFMLAVLPEETLSTRTGPPWLGVR